MGISLLQFILPLALMVAGESHESANLNKTPIDAEIQSIKLPEQSGTDGAVQFIAETRLPASCYLLKPATLRMIYERNVILFHLEAVRTAETCIINDLPLSQVVTVGALPKGVYEVRSLKDLKIWGKIRVQDQISYAQNP